MPTVPRGQVADPFGTKVQGKDQSRPPTSGPPPQMARPTPTEFAMAAATMHELGRLFDPAPLAQVADAKP